MHKKVRIIAQKTAKIESAPLFCYRYLQINYLRSDFNVE